MMLDKQYSYGCEFYGAQPQVGLTPQTDKCYLSMSQAVAMNRGAMLAGGPGVGKTETVRVRLRSHRAIAFAIATSLEMVTWSSMGLFTVSNGQHQSKSDIDIAVVITNAIAQCESTLKYHLNWRKIIEVNVSCVSDVIFIKKAAPTGIEYWSRH